MEFIIKNTAPERISCGCVIVGVFAKAKLTPAAAALDKAASGYLGKVLKNGDLDGNAGRTLLLQKVQGIAAERVLLIGLGPEAEFGEQQFNSAIRHALHALAHIKADEVALCLSASIKNHDKAWMVIQSVIAGEEATYRFDQMKSKREESSGGIRHLTMLGETALTNALNQGVAIAHGMSYAKTLGNLPGNVCTPTYLADAAKKLGKEHNVTVEVLGRKEIEKLKMGSFLSVAHGSAEPPRLIVVKYNGAAASQKPVALVGKGVTFDTGGISLKPAAEMDEMKYDMCGAASVLGTIKAIAEMKLAINVVGVIPATENMPGSRATKPGDVFTSMSGQTIEVLNTDAEGRLILCDALTYAERFEPDAVIDIATLTGACVIALGHIASGLFANDDALADEVLAAGKAVYDRAWQLPLWEDYQEQLRSNFADFANIGGRAGGSITAACFLARFTKKFKWAHLDIAGTAWKSGEKKGSTGRPVPLLTQFLINRAGAKR